MPRELFSAAYEDADVSALKDELAGRDYALTGRDDAGHLRDCSATHPIDIDEPADWFLASRSVVPSRTSRWSAGRDASVQRLLSVGISTQVSTAAPIRETVRESVRAEVARITGLETRIIESDRIPSYASETIGIECLWSRPRAAEPEWKSPRHRCEPIGSRSKA